MIRKIRRSNASCALLLGVMTLASGARAQFTTPTQEELKMTAQPEVPGAPAVYLFREEDTEDKYHTWSKYERIKVLTEAGKSYGDVEVREFHGSELRGYEVTDIQARTIHADGTIIPFTGTVQEKLIESRPGMKEMAKVFVLPDVQVGSIIEYRYKLLYNDHRYIPPTWMVQSALFTRKAHYLWRPTREPVITTDEKGQQITSAIAWTPVLPKNADFTHVTTSGTGIDAGERGQTIMELKIQAVPPAPHEEHMPPVGALDYRVIFYYTPYLSGELFWKTEGKRWSDVRDKFIGPGPKVVEAVKSIAGAGGTQEQTLRKIYAAVMELENTTLTRRQTTAEEGEIKSADDIWTARKGSGEQIAELFVAMTRAAGMKAYLMGVTPRDRGLFMPNYLSVQQMRGYVAIVNVDSKEQFFDPGERYCPYGHLSWQNAAAQGLRQTDSGTSLTFTPVESYKNSRTQRVANLTLDSSGVATGTIKMTWIGAPALSWRQRALRGDNFSLQGELRSSIQGMLPAGMEVTVSGIQNLEQYDDPFVVTFDVAGRLASATGKRLVLPGDLFEARTAPEFPHERREIPVYFQYPYEVLDAVRIALPSGMTVEAVPPNQSVPLGKSASYTFSTESAAGAVTFRRDFALGELMVPVADYADLRSFYAKFEAKDKEPLVLRLAASSGGN